MRIIVIGTECWTFEKFRGTLLKKLILSGHDVIAVGSDLNINSQSFLNSIGVTYHCVGFADGRNDLMSFIFSFRQIIKIFFEFRPNACIAYFIKPILLASLIKFFFNFKLLALVEGLGHPFMIKKNIFYHLLIKCCINVITLKAEKIFCLNSNDKQDILQYSSSKYKSKIKILTGIGVDLNYYKYCYTNRRNYNFIFLSRILKSKGIEEFIHAANKIHTKNLNVSFSVFGQIDRSHLGFNEDILLDLHQKGIIFYGGLVHDIRSILSDASVLVLPTFYREGLPRCIQEALSMGKPVITTKESGCSDLILNKYNGFIIPSRDVDSLIDAIEWFYYNKKQFKQISYNSRKTAEKYFDCNNSDTLLCAELESLTLKQK